MGRLHTKENRRWPSYARVDDLVTEAAKIAGISPSHVYNRDIDVAVVVWARRYVIKRLIRDGFSVYGIGHHLGIDGSSVSRHALKVLSHEPPPLSAYGERKIGGYVE